MLPTAVFAHQQHPGRASSVEFGEEIFRNRCGEKLSNKVS